MLSRFWARERESPPRPPIVFVSIDTFSARHLSLYGYARATSPELERLREDAVVFERCLANAPWTLPSYLSVMSGLYPRAHWVELDYQEGSRIQSFDQFTLAPSRWTLAEALRARGYRTAGFVDTQWLSPQSGVQQGFDLYNGDAALAPFSEVHAGIELIVERLVPPWLATTDADRPPFLFVHALDAHGPYLPEEPFRDAFLPHLTGERSWVPVGSVNQTYRTIPKWMGLTLVPDEDSPLPEAQPVEELVARYDETLLKVDAYLGRLLALLRERGLYDEAAIVVTGDHGEFFGPGVFGHGVMREAVLHVPLILKLPGNARGGQRVETPVSLVDLYPTLLELSGVPAEDSRLHGESWLALLQRGAPRGERALFSEGGHVEQYALDLGRWRLVEEHPGSESSEASLLTHPRVPEEWLRAHAPELLTRPLTEELLRELLARPGFRQEVQALRRRVAGPYYSLYDNESDPGNLCDLARQEPERVERLKARLQAEKQRSRRAREEAGEVLAQPLSPAAMAQLKALGYGGGE
jgi:arylsulfatase A-like enzyme